MSITTHSYGTTKHGEKVDLFRLENKRGTLVEIINYGATITSILTHDREGTLSDIVLGFDDIAGYESADNPYFGATCGRFANRLKKGLFTLNGTSYQLAKNDGENALHGGLRGFDKQIWEAQVNADTLILKRVSPDGEEGYPGNLLVEVTFQLTEENDLRIDYQAETDQPTFINLTNHSYFNLAGGGTIRDHHIQIHADHYTLVDETAIPTGELRAVEGTEMDLRCSLAIGTHIDQVQGLGYDHNYCLNQTDGSLTIAAQVIDPSSGRTLTCLTTEPGVQFYSGNFLNSFIGKAGNIYAKQNGFCLETQHFPDSPNQPSFPSTQLNPSDRYTQTCVYRFGIEK
ncbi:MAG: galactose-1-epimerase [Kiritimatiellaceae bacterium]|jgi:aldose 1-epimerase|nr:galactose-1-epimerase [Kiritimatiellaceae bacterium]